MVGNGQPAFRRAVSTTRVLSVQDGASFPRPDRLAAEEPMEVRAGGPGQEPVSVAVTMRTPGHDFELAAGFLFTEGIVARKGDIARIEYCTDPGVRQEYNIVSTVLRPNVEFRADRLTRHFYMTSSCGVCGKTALEAVRVAVHHVIPTDAPMLDPKTIAAIPERLRKDQALFSETGGLHAAGLFDASGQLSSVREDVGRHNAVDKVVGEAFLAGRTPLTDVVMAVSGRSSFEILQKA